MSDVSGICGEDVFMTEVLDLSDNNENQSICEESNEELMPLGLNQLLREPLRLTKGSDLSHSHGSQTPRNTFHAYGDRKRKNSIRRCLSQVLDNSYHSFTEKPNLSPTFLQFGNHCKDKSPEERKCSSSPTLSPVFTKFKSKTSVDDSENDSLLANTSTSSTSSMTSICSPMFSTTEVNPIKRPIVPKIRKSNSMVSSVTKRQIPFIRCHSANEATIKKAVQMSCADPSLIGDFSKSYALPLINGKHQDLKAVSVDVLAQVLEGHYDDLIELCTVVDCRYPYEYNAGHIRGAKNIYSQEAILHEFIPNRPNTPALHTNANKRRILIFHCEFSSERGPTLSRFLRNNDRSNNKDNYPLLYHPEIYLLEGGYKAFFEKYRNLCEPPEYLPMHSKDHEHELKRFRAIVKSLSTDSKGFGSVFKTY